jgi:hypothetical protein
VIPLAIAPHPAPDPGAALVLVGPGPAPPGFALVRHAGAAAAAQAGGCACCSRPSDLVTALRRLAIERAKGEVDFRRVVVAGDAGLRAELARDPFLAARFRLDASA